MSTEEPKQPGYQWKRWKIAAIVFAGVLVVAGGLAALGGGDDEPARTASAPDREIELPGGESFGPGTIPSPPTEGDVPPGDDASLEDVAADDPVSWSPALLRGGLSFFVAFALAFAFRTVLRIALFFVGVWGASIFLLSWAGWLEVHWEVIDVAFDSFAGRIGEQFESFSHFITGSLPSAGMAGLGLFTGFRKK